MIKTQVTNQIMDNSLALLVFFKVSILIQLILIQQVTGLGDILELVSRSGSSVRFGDAIYLLNDCDDTHRLDLDDDECSYLKLSDVTEFDPNEWGSVEAFSASVKQCACQLANMEDIYDNAFHDREVKRLAVMVNGLTSKVQDSKEDWPDFLWSNVDFLSKKVSILKITKENLHYLFVNKHLVHDTLESDEIWQVIFKFCTSIVESHNLYEYLENLNKADHVVFYSLILHSDIIGNVFHASKACKILFKAASNPK